MKPATEILLSAAFALTPKENWAQGCYAKTERGFPTELDAADAVCFCALGAIKAAACALDNGSLDAAHYLRLAINNATGSGVITRFNDARRRRHAEVLDALYRAAEIAEAS